MFTPSAIIDEISAYPIKSKTFDLENEGKGQGVEKRNLHRSTENIRFYAVVIFQNVSYSTTYVYAKGNTHTHTQRETRG